MYAPNLNLKRIHECFVLIMLYVVKTKCKGCTLYNIEFIIQFHSYLNVQLLMHLIYVGVKILNDYKIESITFHKTLSVKLKKKE